MPAGDTRPKPIRTGPDAGVGNGAGPLAPIDNAPWSETAIEDLKNHVAHGATLEETASFLCRAGTHEDVAKRQKRLSLKWQTGGHKRTPKD